ncbi:unnamed protein product [Owenia fusiformis]|uniref:Uncharacterized protein n=1 Tax=Owenia fusiformis TaxID=6347 RepID=A0A8J1TZ35_OWEFU|nr:unnamed protein product [Owenia fusiformis]
MITKILNWKLFGFIVIVLLLSLNALMLFQITSHIDVSSKTLEYVKTENNETVNTEIYLSNTTRRYQKQADTTNRKCNLKFLQDFTRTEDELYSKGSWENTSWTPEGCRFSSKDPDLKTCFREHQIRKILMLGDSNGARYANYTAKYLRRFFSCELIKREANNKLPTAQYWKDVKRMYMMERDCYTCSSMLYKCLTHSSEIVILDFEFIAMEYYMDTEMTTFRIGYPRSCNFRQVPYLNKGILCGHALTTQQFIFNEYLYTQPHYPTVIIIIGNSHELLRRDKTDLQRDVDWFLKVLKSAVHKNTKIFWFEPPYATGMGWLARYFDENIYKWYGNWARDVVLDYFKSDPKLFYPFYSVYELSKSSGSLLDGIHYTECYYTAIMELFFKTLCEP